MTMRNHTTIRHTTEQIVKIGWKVLLHPPYSPHLAPSNFSLFGPLKEAHRRVYFEKEEALKTSVRQRFWNHETFYHVGIYGRFKRWIKSVEIDGGYIEK